MNNPETNVPQPHEDEPVAEQTKGGYSKAERMQFAEYFGPGAPVAIESIRKMKGIRFNVTRGKSTR